MAKFRSAAITLLATGLVTVAGLLLYNGCHQLERMSEDMIQLGRLVALVLRMFG